MKKYKVLLADDDKAIRELIAFLLKPFDFDILQAKDGEEAMNIIEREKIDILITDVNMPHITGFEICKKVKDNGKYGFIYVIILSGSSVSPEAKETGFDFGADDYICKPFHNKEFLGRIKAALRIKKIHDEVSLLAVTDELTGLYNRRYFEQLSAEEFYRAERYGRKISCLFIDIDHFKKINDNHGHEAGDYVLKKVADVLKNSVCKSDALRNFGSEFRGSVCRWGGEEFVVLLPETKGQSAELTAEHLRKEVERNAFDYNGNKIFLTISVGFASFPEGATTNSQDILTHADIALYRAKRDGRNCTRCLEGAV